MEASALADYVRDKLGDRVVAAEVTYDQVTVTVVPDSYPTAARLCKEDKALACDFFDFLCGVDERDAGFGVVTRLYSVAHRHGVTLRTIADGGREEPRVPTLTGVYRGADWHEREAYDMFGIVFEGHPGLLPRLLTVENFEGWPLRKEFRLASRDVKPWPGAKEPGGEGEPQAAGTPAASARAGAEAAAPVDKAAAAKAKAERAKALAAEARKRKAAEQAAALSAQDAGEETLESAAADADGVAIEDAAEAIAEAPTAAEAATVAAELDQSDETMDAAAGAVTGDTAAGAASDEPGVDEPRPDPEAEEQEDQDGLDGQEEGRDE